MTVRDLVGVLDREESVMVCNENSDWIGTFPVKFVPPWFMPDKIKLLKYDKEKNAINIYIEREMNRG